MNDYYGHPEEWCIVYMKGGGASYWFDIEHYQEIKNKLIQFINSDGNEGKIIELSSGHTLSHVLVTSTIESVARVHISEWIDDHKKDAAKAKLKKEIMGFDEE